MFLCYLYLLCLPQGVLLALLPQLQMNTFILYPCGAFLGVIGTAYWLRGGTSTAQKEALIAMLVLPNLLVFQYMLLPEWRLTILCLYPGGAAIGAVLTLHYYLCGAGMQKPEDKASYQNISDSAKVPEHDITKYERKLQ